MLLHRFSDRYITSTTMAVSIRYFIAYTKEQTVLFYIERREMCTTSRKKTKRNNKKETSRNVIFTYVRLGNEENKIISTV